MKAKPILFYIGIIIISLKGCSENSNVSKTIDFKAFKIKVPMTWNKLDSLKAIDSYIGGISTQVGDTIYFDYGLYSPNFNESVLVAPKSDKKALDSAGIKNVVYSDNYEIDIHQAAYLKHYYYYDTIGHERVKYMIPKKIGSGHIGVFFKNIDRKGNSLSLYSKDLVTAVHFQFLEAVKTIEIN